MAISHELERVSFVLQNVWDELPAGDILFQSKLRSAVRSIMNNNSSSVDDVFNLSYWVFFINRGLSLRSIPIGSGCYFSPSDKEESLACTCLAKLLIEIICISHSKKSYFVHVLMDIKEAFQNP